MAKRVLVYPCGTEIGLEIYRAVNNSIHYELIGGSSTYDHGRFIYKKHIDNLPFITDNSDEDDIREFDRVIEKYNIDIIYPAMDGVITVFSKYRELLKPLVIAPDYKATFITRSKSRTYSLLQEKVNVPRVYLNKTEVKKFPVFVKPDVGQGARGTEKIKDRKELDKLDMQGRLLLEYLPGEEYTIDCFTNRKGKLVYARGRGRKRIKDGISVNAVFEDDAEFVQWAEIINEKIQQIGAWFFQVKRDIKGQLKLLEVASRIAGTSAITRCIGVNLPLLTLEVYDGKDIDDVLINDYSIELDRALENKYKVELEYQVVYVDYDDTLVTENSVNCDVIKFLYQCLNLGKKIVLLSRHKGNLIQDMKKYRLEGIFDEIIHIEANRHKSDYINQENAIFIDDSYGERREVFLAKKIPVFDIHMIEALMEE